MDRDDRMKANCEVTIMGGSLLCHVDGEDWYLSIRMADIAASPDGVFSAYGKTPQIEPSDVERFIPNWSTVTWKAIPDDALLAHSESLAVDGKFRINVGANRDSPKNHQDVVDAFLNFMRS